MPSAPPSLPRRYSVLRPLGHGGEGTVYLVRDALLGGKLLALKVIRPGEEDDRPDPGTGTDPLRSEFLVSISLAHPALARVRDFGLLEGGGAWFTSDHVPGVDILEWGLAHPFPLDWPSFFAAAAQALGALHAIHSAGFVHGDVKPSNVLVQAIPDPPRLRLTVIDFGSARIARAVNAGRSGTPAYLAPPSLGDGPEADLYSLGLSLFHAAAGSLPFALGNEGDLLAWRLAGRPARLSERVEDVPAAASELVERLTAPPGEGRFHSAGEALDFLKRKTSGVSLVLPAAEGPGRLVGRDAELGAILSALADSRAPLVVVASPPGLGKSRLLWEVSRRAQLEGFRVVAADPADPALALKELLDLVPGSSGVLPADDPARLGAELHEKVADVRVLLTIDGLLDSMVNPARSEDEPVADPFTARVLLSFARSHLARPPRAARLVAASVRPDSLRRALAAAPDRYREVHLEPLGRDRIREMAVEHWRTEQVPDAAIDRLAAASQGAPGRVRAALSALDGLGAKVDPLGLVILPPERREGELISPASRRPALGPLERRALAVIALGPGPLEARLVARWAPLVEPPLEGTNPEEVWDTVLEGLCWDGRLFRAGSAPARYGLAVRVARRIEPAVDPAPRRIRERIFEDLRRESTLPGERDPDRLLALARAALSAGDRILDRAARHALRRLRSRLRFADALRLIREVLEGGGSLVPERSRKLLALRGAELALLHGKRADLAEVRGHLERFARPPAPARSRVPFLLLLSRIDERAGQLASAASSLEAALEVIGRPGARPPASWYEASARLSVLRYALGRPELAAPLLSRGEDLARQLASAAGGRPLPEEPLFLDLPACARALSLFGMLIARHGDPSSLDGLLAASIDLARRTGRQDLLAAPLHELALVHAGRGDRAAARRALEECLRIAESSGNRSALLRSTVNLATLLQKEGSLDEAEDLFRKARTLADELGEDVPGAAAWMGLWVIRRDRGDLFEALRLGRGILRRFPRSRRTLHATAHFNLGDVYLSLGRPERARRERARALAMARSCDYRFLIGYALMGLGAARWSVGDLSGAEKRLRRAIELAEDPPPPAEGPDHLLLALALHLLGMVQARKGERRAAYRSLGKAMFHSRRSSSPAHRESSHLALVHLLLEDRRRTRAAALISALDRPGRGPLTGRHRSLIEALATRSSPSWPADIGPVVESAERAEAAGDVLLALRILNEALEDPELEPSPPPELLARREALAARFLRRSPERDRAFFRRTHGKGVPPPPAGRDGVRPSTSLHGGAEDRRLGDPLVALAARWAEGPGDPGPPSASARGKRGDGPSRIEVELAHLRDAIPAEGVWVLNEPGSREPMFYSPDPEGPPLDLFSDRAPIIQTARDATGPCWEGGLAAIRIPGPRARARRERRVLCVKVDAAKAGDPSLRTRIELAAGLLGCLFRLRASEAERRADRDRLRESAQEVHRLNVLMASAKGQLETAVITRRLIAVERREAEEADRFSRGGRLLPAARSPRMRDLLRRLARIAAEDIPVLILGESGVGKDLLARAIHFQSPRAKGPFVSEVCAIPESLLESELFGFVRGAFTGAHEDRPGLLQLCHGGTLYLDEISEMSSALQARLAGVLAERRARPIGAEAPKPIDLRLVSSSRRSLKELEDSGDLRREFFYRIRGEVMEMPPLRERREDIPLLVEEFVQAIAREREVPPPSVEPELLSHLARLSWPGNIRQLENEVRRAFLLQPDRLTLASFRAGEASASPSALSSGVAASLLPFREARDGFEQDLIIEALKAHGGNASRAARSLQITRRYLGMLLAKHGIRLSEFGS